MMKRNFPLLITIAVFLLGYAFCLSQFPSFASTRVWCDLLTDNAFLGIVAVGMTFVILSGGISFRGLSDRFYRCAARQVNWYLWHCSRLCVRNCITDGRLVWSIDGLDH